MPYPNREKLADESLYFHERRRDVGSEQAAEEMARQFRAHSDFLAFNGETIALKVKLIPERFGWKGVTRFGLGLEEEMAEGAGVVVGREECEGALGRRGGWPEGAVSRSGTRDERGFGKED